MKKPLYLGCTKARHKQLGINAVVNARGGLLHLNEQTDEEIEMARDARGIRDWLSRRVRWYGPFSRFFRRNRRRIEHLIARNDD